MTGSLLWDSQNNVWIYSNPSGSSTYDSAMVLMGPRNSSGLGNEVGISTNYLAKGDGSHHLITSAIWNSGSLIRLENNTQVTGTLEVSAGITGSLFGTASWATNFASSSDYVPNSQTGSFLLNSQTSSMIVLSSSFASTASYIAGYVQNSQTSSFVTNNQTSSLLITASVSLNTLTFTKGDGSQFNLTVNTGSNSIGSANGNSLYSIIPAAGVPTATNSNFFGFQAGIGATGANNSNFFGYSAGYYASGAFDSNFIGNGAGYQSTNAYDSNMIGANAGSNAKYASFSNFLN